MRYVACGDSHVLCLAEGGRQVLSRGVGLAHDVLHVPELRCVAAGYFQSVAITCEGELLLLSYGPERPTCVMPGIAVANVACGNCHTLVVTCAGALWAFGDGSAGQLGTGDTLSRCVPVEIMFPGRAAVAHAAAGSAFSGAVTVDGRVWTWGCGEYGRLGHGDEAQVLAPRTLCAELGHACAVSAGFASTMVVTTSGALWAFGMGAYGQLGLGDRRDRYTPARVHLVDVRAVALGYHHAVARAGADGAVWSWGGGGGPWPAKIDAAYFGGGRVVDVDAGFGHSAAVCEDGMLYTWDIVQGHPPAAVPLDVRIGRGLPLAHDRALAVVMGTHARLGAASSGIHRLGGEPGLLAMICAFCADGVPHDGAAKK